jgi:hypothetical protein
MDAQKKSPQRSRVNFVVSTAEVQRKKVPIGIGARGGQERGERIGRGAGVERGGPIRSPQSATRNFLPSAFTLIISPLSTTGVTACPNDSRF